MELDPKYKKEETLSQFLNQKTNKKWNLSKFNYNTQTLSNITDSAKNTKPHDKKQIKNPKFISKLMRTSCKKTPKAQTKKPKSNFHLERERKENPFVILATKL